MPLPFTDLARFIAASLDRSARSPAPSLKSAKEIGNYGERVAASFLRGHGYRVLYRNFATEGGELDLICRCRDVLVFVEVRTRSGVEFGRPVETIHAGKRENLRFAAQRYLEMLEQPDIFHRFDAVEVILQPGKIPACTLQINLFA